MDKQKLKLALDIISEGVSPSIPEVFHAEALDRHRSAKSWIFGDLIQGFGIGRRLTEGRRSEELVLKVYVEKKLPLAELGKAGVPKVIDLPILGGEVETDVEAIGKVSFELDRSRHRPAFPGCGLGHVRTTVGTFGCLVRKQGDPDGLYILSNSHVLADEGTASIGDEIIQPGDYDQGSSPSDVIAHLSEFIPFDFTQGYPNLVDAAIGKVLRNDLVVSGIGVIGVPPQGIGQARVGTKIKKVGRTTGFTHGEVLDVDFRTAINYKTSGGGSGVAGFRDQVLCTRYTAGGDSGSAVLHETSNKILGLHFAGSESASIFNKIGNVIDALKIEVITANL